MSGPVLAGTWYLPTDTDVLIQAFKVGPQLMAIFRLLRRYGAQTAIVDEVERELAWHAKFKDYFDGPTQKAIASGVLVRLDRATIEKQIAIATTPVAGVATGEAFQTLGREYAKRVGSGEAYTFAAAVTLGSPAVSNDFSAIQTLSSLGLAIPSPVLRFLDLVVFAHQAGEIDVKECDRIRRDLITTGESITPKGFQRAAFEDALAGFQPRLIDGDRPMVGRGGSGPEAFKIAKIVRLTTGG